ncbi:hypothetical protein [Ruminococcus sp. JL13D9]|uniref:hypothetical protein n=1 Tax=Ruminococcus sp. JL13D9 TaxID=3233381 RepID=UPI00389AC9E7
MDFDRQEALRVCHIYYRNKGYSEEHCQTWLDHQDDQTLKNAYYCILKEQKNAERKGFSVL